MTGVGAETPSDEKRSIMGLDDIVDNAKDFAEDAAEKAKHIAGDVADKAKDAAGEVKDRAEHLIHGDDGDKPAAAPSSGGTGV